MNISNTLRAEVDKYIRSASASMKINDEIYEDILESLESIEKEEIFIDDPKDGDGFAIIVDEKTNGVVLSLASPEIDFGSESAMVDLIEAADFIRATTDDGFVILSLVFNAVIEMC